MNRQEAVALTRYVKACCPQQAIDEYTPDAWHDLLGDLDLGACRQAAACVARRQPFVSPAEIRAEVRSERQQRLASCRSDTFMPHGETADNVAEYLREVRQRISTVAKGSITAGGGLVQHAGEDPSPRQRSTQRPTNSKD